MATTADIVTEALVAQLQRHGRAIDFTDRNLDLRTDIGADELDLVSIAMDLEEQLGIDLPDHELTEIATIDQLHSAVEAKVDQIRRAA